MAMGVSKARFWLGLLLVLAILSLGEAWLTFALALAALVMAGLAIWLARRRERKQRLKRQALRNDLVTDLPGRVLLERHLQRFMDDAYAVSLYYLAFDALRHLRAQFGVECADLAAQGIAERLRDTCGGVCYPARLSDDVFVVAASGAQDPMAMAARYQEMLHAPIEVHGVPHRVEPRIGVAVSPEHGKTPTALLQAAQDAADQVLASAGAEPQLFKLDLLKTSERRRFLAETLADALEQDPPILRAVSAAPVSSRQSATGRRRSLDSLAARRVRHYIAR